MTAAPPPRDQRARFIPVRRHQLTQKLVEANGDGFARAAELLHHVLRFEADGRAEQLSDCYAPFDPDPLVPTDSDDDPEAFLAAADEVLEEANFRRVSEEEIQAAFGEKSLFPLQAQVDLEEYDILRLYRRGASTRDEKVRGWSTLWRWKTRRLELFERLVVIMRLKDEVLAGDDTFRTEGMEPGKIYLKLFKNVPKADLEMVLPNTQLRLRRLDRALIGGPLIFGVGWTLFQSIGIIAAIVTGAFALSLDDPGLRAFGGFLLVLGGYLWKTHSKVKTTRLKYIKTLSQGLYFRNLANNRAVLEQLLAYAQDEEEKEAVLAYHLLISEKDMNTAQLDARAEAWIQEYAGRAADFDVDDGIHRLKGLGLIKYTGGKWHAVKPATASKTLDKRWDEAFHGGRPAKAA